MRMTKALPTKTLNTNTSTIQRKYYTEGPNICLCLRDKIMCNKEMRNLLQHVPSAGQVIT